MLNFKQFCEEDQSVSFESSVLPFIEDFSNKLITNFLSQDKKEFNPNQVKYVLDKLKERLNKAKYDKDRDLSSAISDIYKGANKSSERAGEETPLVDRINRLFKKKI